MREEDKRGIKVNKHIIKMKINIIFNLLII